MRLAAVFGRGTANLIMLAAANSAGYALAYFGPVKVIVELLEFRRLENELGRPILLAEEPLSQK
jgi:hypothetical protein